MITATSEPQKHRTKLTDDKNVAFADTGADHGGGETAFLPHQLLEAALASCLNMTARIYAEKHELPLTGVETTVSLNRDDKERPVFECAAKLQGELSDEQRTAILAAIRHCPVSKTLTRQLTVEWM